MPISAYFCGKHLDAGLRSHLSKVYACLSYTLLAAALGAKVGGPLNLAWLSLVCLAYLFITSGREKMDAGRFAALTGLGLFTGVGISPLVKMAMYVDPRILVTSVLATAGIFVCFTLAAMIAPRNYYLYLGGYLLGGLYILLLFRVLRIYYNVSSFENADLAIGLFTFMGYIVFDTQVIVYRYGEGARDYMTHSVELFLDVINVFVRILILILILVLKSKEK